MDNDEQIFNFFKHWRPSFAGDSIKEQECWSPHKVPDMFCLLHNGKRIGIELAEWMHEDTKSTTAAYEDLFIEALEGQGITEWGLLPEIKSAAFKISDKAKLKEEILNLTKKIIDRAKDKNHEYVEKLKEEGVPTLANYCSAILYLKTEHTVVKSSLSPAALNGSFVFVARNALEKILTKKLYKQSYPNARAVHKLDELYLLVHYELSNKKGLIFGQSDVVSAANEVFQKISTINPFDKAFLVSVNYFINSAGIPYHTIANRALNFDLPSDIKKPFICAQFWPVIDKLE